MSAGSLPPRRSLVLAASDVAAIALFVTIGLLSHHKGLSVGGYARDALPLAAGWFAAAALFGTYRRPGAGRVLATWALGVSAGVQLRALALGHSLDGPEAAFLGVCLAMIGALVLALRATLRLAGHPFTPAGPRPGGPLPARLDRAGD